MMSKYLLLQFDKSRDTTTSCVVDRLLTKPVSCLAGVSA